MPISGQQFGAVFQSDESVSVIYQNGDKIFIVIDPMLVDDPTMIDPDTPVNYSLGEGIGQIMVAPEYPSHTNYLKLYEIGVSGEIIDMRPTIHIDPEVIKTLSITKIRDENGDPINLATDESVDVKIAQASAISALTTKATA